MIQLAFQLGLAALKSGHSVINLSTGHAATDGIDQPVDILRDLFQFAARTVQRCAGFYPQQVYVARIFLAECSEEFRRHHVFAQAVQHHLFERVPPERAAIVAGPFVAGIGTADAGAVEVNDAAAADAAAHEAGKQVARPLAIPEFQPVGVPVGGIVRLPAFDRLPEFIVYQTQVRDVMDDQFGVRVGPGNALAGFRVFDVAQAVPDQLPDIEFVVEDARAALAIAVDG